MATKGVFFLDRNRHLVPVSWLIYDDTDGDVGVVDSYIDTDQLANGSVTREKIAAKTITHTEISDTAGILGPQLAAAAGILGAQLDNNAQIAGSQLRANAELEPSQLGRLNVQCGEGFITYNDGKTAHTIIDIPAGSLVTGILAHCNGSFDGTALTVEVGDEDDPDGFLPAANVGIVNGNTSGDDPAMRGAYLWAAGTQGGDEGVTAWGRQLVKYYPTEKHVQSTLSYTGASKGTTGGITVWIFYVRLA
jgi:hypothetical protein